MRYFDPGVLLVTIHNEIKFESLDIAAQDRVDEGQIPVEDDIVGHDNFTRPVHKPGQCRKYVFPRTGQGAAG